MKRFIIITSLLILALFTTSCASWFVVEKQEELRGMIEDLPKFYKTVRVAGVKEDTPLDMVDRIHLEARNLCRFYHLNNMDVRCTGLSECYPVGRADIICY